MRIRKFVSEIYWPLVFSLLCQNAVVLLKSMKVVKPQKVSFVPYSKKCVKISVRQFRDFAYLFEYRRNENDLWDLGIFINLCHEHDCRNNKKIKKTKSCKNYVVCDSVTKTGVCKLFFRCQIALALCHQRYELYIKSHNMRVKHCNNARTSKRILKLDKNVEYSLVEGLIRICIKWGY